MPTAKPQTTSDPSDEPLNPLAICACNNLRKASRAVTQYFDERLQATGLRSTQLVILLAVMQNNGGSIAQIARTLGMDASTLNRNLRPLEDRGLIKIVPGASGQRKVVTLTKSGQKAVEDAAPVWEAAQNQLVERVGENRYSGMLTDLRLVVEATRD